MLELLLLLPFIIVSILSVTFDIYVDEFSNVNRGNFFQYDTPSRDNSKIGQLRPIYFNLIITEEKAVAFIPQCTPVEDDLSSVNDWVAAAQLKDVTEFLSSIQAKSQTDDIKTETTLHKEAGNDGKKNLRLCLEGEVFYNNLNRKSQSKGSTKRWKPPV